MDIKDVPELLNIPPKLIPMITPEVINRVRYILLEGGRGGGKSQSVARFLLYLADQKRLRFVCAREFQTTLAESSYTLLSDLIQRYELDFEVMASKIIHRKTGSTFTFRGLRESEAFSIQGLEAVDIVFVDEAQALSQRTLEVLIPTIRKDTSKIIFSMNRFLPNDPVYAMFVGRSDCLHLKINYDENPFCPEALQREAAVCRLKSQADYDHIWLGLPKDLTDDSLYSVSELEDSKSKKFEAHEGYGLRVMGVDIARFGDDANAVVILEQMDMINWRLVYSAEWTKQDLNWTTGHILELIKKYGVNRAIIDADGMGAGPFDALSRGHNLDMIKGFRNTKIDDKEFVNRRTKYAYKLKGLLRDGHIAIGDDKLISELLMIKYTFDASQRRILVSKDQMRKQGVKSPNRADACFYAVSLIEEVMDDQQPRVGTWNQPRYCTGYDTWDPFQ